MFDLTTFRSFMGINALFMFIGVWRYRWRACSVYCPVFMCLFQFIVLITANGFAFRDVDYDLCRVISIIRVAPRGNKEGGLHLLKQSSRKRRRAEVFLTHDFSTTIAESLGQTTEIDVFKGAQVA